MSPEEYGRIVAPVLKKNSRLCKLYTEDAVAAAVADAWLLVQSGKCPAKVPSILALIRTRAARNEIDTARHERGTYTDQKTGKRRVHGHASLDAPTMNEGETYRDILPADAAHDAVGHAGSGVMAKSQPVRYELPGARKAILAALREAKADDLRAQLAILDMRALALHKRSPAYRQVQAERAILEGRLARLSSALDEEGKDK